MEAEVRMDFPYKRIMVAVDNSQCSDSATGLAIDLAAKGGAKLTGVHVYAARLHDDRFRQMEPGLPERYQKEEILQHQREVHDDLIGRGLSIISNSYLDLFERRCVEADVPGERKALEGRNYAELVRDARETGYDLVIIGAHGLGRVERSILGSVCERVCRLVDGDVLVVRDARLRSGPLLVAMDGSPASFSALEVALSLSRAYGLSLSAVAAYDPFYHSVAFASIAGVLSEENARLFRFREQEALHEEVIDGGLREVYRSHLVRAQAVARDQGVDLEIEVLEGKPFDAIASHVSRVQPSLLLAGRVGIHHDEGVALGSTAENLVRCAGCNVLLVKEGHQEMREDSLETQVSAAAPSWTADAAARLERIPFFVRKMARKRIEEYARERGVAEVNLEVYEEARRKFRM
jgi:nucleotide-binding universal stress UspA family protein